MKYLFLFVIIISFNSNVYSQNTKDYVNFITAGGGFNFGAKDVGEFELVAEFLKYKGKKYSNGYSLSLGIAMPYENKRWGDSYNGIISELHSGDYRESGFEKNGGGYLGLGYTINRFSLLGKIGLYTDIYYENGYNSIMGLHHITKGGNEYFLYGGSINVKANKWLSFTLGYNNFTDLSVGMNFRYSKF